MDKKEKSNQKMIIDLIKAISGQANILTIPRLFTSLTGDIESALFLSQCIYWSDRSSIGDGWFYKSQVEWTSETGLTRRKIDRIKKDLSERNFIAYELRTIKSGAPVCHFRANLEGIISLLQNLPVSQPEDDHLYKTDKSICTERTNAFVQNVQMHLYKTRKSLKTETTPEINSEITTETSSSYSDHENLNQEEEDNRKISKDLASLLEEMGVFDDLWPEVANSEWNVVQLIELAHRVLNGSYNNPAAIFIWRIRNQKPRRLLRNKLQMDENPGPIYEELELEQIPDQVISAWSMVIDQLYQELPQVEFNTWIDPIQIKSFNGSLILCAANRFVLDNLQRLQLTNDVLSEYFSGYLGQSVPIQFVVG